MIFLKYIYPFFYFVSIIIILGRSYRRYFYKDTDFTWLAIITLAINSLTVFFYAFMNLSETMFTAYQFAQYATMTSMIMFPVLVALVFSFSEEYGKKNVMETQRRTIAPRTIIVNTLSWFLMLLIAVIMYVKPPSILSLKPVSFANGEYSFIYGWSNNSPYALIITVMNMIQLNFLFYKALFLQKKTAENTVKVKIKTDIAVCTLCNMLIFLFDIILPLFQRYVVPTITPIVFGVMIVSILKILGRIPQNKIFPQVFALKIFNTVEDAVVFIDSDFKIIYTNKFFNKLFEVDDSIKKDIRVFLPANFDMQKLTTDHTEIIQISTSKKKYLQMKYAVQLDRYGDLLGSVLIFHDFTALIVKALALGYETKNINEKVFDKNKQFVKQNRYMQAQIKQKNFLHNEYLHLLEIDTLTQAYNGNYFLHAVENKIANNETNFSVFSIDIKDFKYINDLRGHWFGDFVLIKVVDTIHRFISADNAVLSRTDGDNFLLLHNSISNVNDAIIFARVLSNLISEIKTVNNFEISISVLIGICIYERGMTAEEIIDNASLASLQANTQEGTRYVVFTPEISRNITERFKLIAEIKHACDNNEFIPFYQPQVLVKRDGSQKIIGYESLVRWQHPKRGLLSPFYFIEVAESSGSVVPMSYSILRQACLDINTLLQSGFHDFTVSVNLSAKQLNSEAFIKTVSDIFAETNVDTGHLEFEITETELLVYNKRILAKCIELKKMGIKISVDDFGVAFASFNYIKTLPIDKMKIDKSFVDEIGKNKRIEQILYIVMEFAKVCNLKIVVEGVEYKEQLDFLLQQNDNIIIQGYYFYKPVPFKNIFNEKILPYYDAKHYGE